MSFQYAYLIFDLLYGLIWLALFAHRSDLRHKMLVMSFILGLVGLAVEPFYIRDYWRPELHNGWVIGFEDFLWSFFLGGIIVVIYEEILGKYYSKRHLKQHKIWMLFFFLYFLIGLVVGSVIFKVNSVYVSCIIFLLASIVVLIYRHDLLLNALFSSILVSAIMFGIYLVFLPMYPGIIPRWWMLQNLSGHMYLGVPIEEYLWGACAGAVGGPLYEFLIGATYKKQKGA